MADGSIVVGEVERTSIRCRPSTIDHRPSTINHRPSRPGGARNMAVEMKAIEALLEESRVFPPPPEFRKNAWVKSDEVYERARRDPEGFWAERAAELHWFRKWDKVLEWEAPFAKWFVGGQLNASFICLDRHIGTPRQNKVAIFWEGEYGEQRVFTYREL